MKWTLLIFTALFMACGETNKPVANDSVVAQDSFPPKDSVRSSGIPDSVPADVAMKMTRPSQESMSELFKRIIPAGWELMDTMTGNLNRDAYLDMLVILKNPAEDSMTEMVRPLLVLIGNADGVFNVAARNDSVVLCKGCGGIFGDPYDGMAIRNGYFSIEHYGGSNWRWTRVMTFKYNNDKQAWFLSRDAGIDYHTSEPDKETESVFNKESYGKQNFTEYRYMQ
ncbi:MAG TPA: hypothetical protein VK826_08280 [Bacteroidia bacterium]|nr:hypothetical protein [Bacteroidia bacterium]